MESRIKAACWSTPLAAFRAIVSKPSKAALLWLRFCSAIARIQSVVCAACSVVCRAKSIVPLVIAFLLEATPRRTVLIRGRFRARGVALCAPHRPLCSITDSRNCGSEKLLKLSTRRSDSRRRFQTTEFATAKRIIFQYVIAVFSSSEVCLSANCLLRGEEGHEATLPQRSIMQIYGTCGARTQADDVHV